MPFLLLLASPGGQANGSAVSPMSFKLFLQDSPNDCGPACLASIFHHLGLYITPIDLAKELEITRAGTSNVEIARMAAHFGLRSKLIQLSIDDFDRITDPCIAYVRTQQEDMQHNVVIFKVSPKYIWIGDPAYGKRKVTRAKFAETYLGMLMIFSPDESFAKARLSEPYLVKFLRFVMAWRNKILITLAIGLVTSALGFGIIYLSKYFVDSILVEQQISLILVFALVFLLARILTTITGGVNQFVTILIRTSVAKILSERFFTRMLGLEKRHIDSRDEGDFLQQFSQIEMLTEGIASYFSNFVLVVFGILIKTVFLLAIYNDSPLLVATILAVLLLNASLGFLFARVTAEKTNRQGFIFGQLNTAILDSITDIRVVRVFQATDWARRMYKTLLDEGILLLKRVATLNIYGQSMADLLKTLAEAAIFIVCGMQIIQGNYTVGDFLVFLAFAQGLATESLQFPGLVLNFQTQLRSFARVQAIFELSQERTDGKVIEASALEITFRDVSFSYALGEPVLRDLSFTLPKNRTTAIVGESGSGKTTIMNLIMGFYKPRSGASLVNGVELAEVDLASYRASISAVFQDTSIFNRNVYNNVSFANPEIPLQRVQEVARALGMESFIEGLPGGYKALIYQGGLSGGQTQRIGILRAMCKPFKLLLMDEATSHLDSRTEERIVQGIDTLSGQGRTRMIIAHRLSTVMAADQIIVMKDGQAVEMGSHEELVAMKGHYLDLIQRQYEVDLAPPPRLENA